MQNTDDDNIAQRAGTTMRGPVRELIEYDDARASAPQEHTVTLLAATGLALSALRTPTRVAAVCQAMLAGALLLRAASGRDGVRRWAGARPARPLEAGTPGQASSRTNGTAYGPEASDPLPGAGYAGA